MTRWWLTVLGAAALAVTVEVLPHGAPRQVLALGLGLLVPGFAVLAAAAPGRPRAHGPFAVALAALLSCAVIALTAVVVHALGERFTADNVLIGVGIVVIPCLLIALLRRGALADEPPGEGEWAAFLPALAVAVVGIGLVAVLQTTRETPTPVPFSAFAFASGEALNGEILPVPRGGRVEVPIEVTSTHGAPRTYRLMARVDGRVDWPWASVEVPARGRATVRLGGPVPGDGCLHRIAIEMADLSDPGHTFRAITAYASSDPRSPCVGR